MFSQTRQSCQELIREGLLLRVCRIPFTRHDSEPNCYNRILGGGGGGRKGFLTYQLTGICHIGRKIGTHNSAHFEEFRVILPHIYRKSGPWFRTLWNISCNLYIVANISAEQCLKVIPVIPKVPLKMAHPRPINILKIPPEVASHWNRSLLLATARLADSLLKQITETSTKKHK